MRITLGSYDRRKASELKIASGNFPGHGTIPPPPKGARTGYGLYDGKKWIGFVELTKPFRKKKVYDRRNAAYVGVAIAPEYRKRGLAEKMTKELLRKHPEIKKWWWQALSTNKPSLQLGRKLGFKDPSSKSRIHMPPRKLGKYTNLEKTAGALQAYVTGPSGAGKATYVKKNYPLSKFTVLHTDDFSDAGPKYKANWKTIRRRIRASKKPVVLEGVAVDRALAKRARERIVVNPGFFRTLLQRKRRGIKNDRQVRHGVRMYLEYKATAHPIAKALGFKVVGLKKTAALGQKPLKVKLPKTSKYIAQIATQKQKSPSYSPHAIDEIA